MKSRFDVRRYLFWGTLASIIAVNILLAACSGTMSVRQPSSTPQPTRSSQMEELPQGSRSGKSGLPTLSTVLNQLLTDWQIAPDAAIEQAISQGLEIEGDRVKIMLIMHDEDSAEAAASAIPGLGGEVEDRYKTWIDAWVSIGSLRAIAELPGVSQVREPIEVVPLD